MAEASFVGPHELEIRPREGHAYAIEAERIFINTGARPSVPALPGLEQVPFFTRPPSWSSTRSPNTC